MLSCEACGASANNCDCTCSECGQEIPLNIDCPNRCLIGDYRTEQGIKQRQLPAVVMAQGQVCLEEGDIVLPTRAETCGDRCEVCLNYSSLNTRDDRYQRGRWFTSQNVCSRRCAAVTLKTCTGYEFLPDRLAIKAGYLDCQQCGSRRLSARYLRVCNFMGAWGWRQYAELICQNCHIKAMPEQDWGGST